MPVDGNQSDASASVPDDGSCGLRAARPICVGATAVSDSGRPFYRKQPAVFTKDRFQDCLDVTIQKQRIKAALKKIQLSLFRNPHELAKCRAERHKLLAELGQLHLRLKRQCFRWTCLDGMSSEKCDALDCGDDSDEEGETAALEEQPCALRPAPPSPKPCWQTGDEACQYCAASGVSSPFEQFLMRCKRQTLLSFDWDRHMGHVILDLWDLPFVSSSKVSRRSVGGMEDRDQLRFLYACRGRKVCRQTYFWSLGIGEKLAERIQRHVKDDRAEAKLKFESGGGGGGGGRGGGGGPRNVPASVLLFVVVVAVVVVEAAAVASSSCRPALTSDASSVPRT